MSPNHNALSAPLTGNVLSLRQIASWSLPDLRPENPHYAVASVPSLQRGLVWKPNQTELLWDSLLRGFPIGAFVLCRKLQRQRRRNENAAYDLLDGQQRAHAVGLGFEDPFVGGEHDRRPILWMDLAPSSQPGTKTFPLRVTTEAHPWGFQADDAASPLPIWQVREILKKSGRMNDQGNLVHEPGGALERPLPRTLWPAAAEIPIPFAWLMACEKEEPEAFWNAVREAVQGQMQHQIWAQKATHFLNSVSVRDEPKLHAIWNGVIRAREARIVWLEVPEDALTSASAQEGARPVFQDGTAEVTSVEHLFYRLNAGGTRLDGDELAYSMIKARWPELEEPIKRLACRRLPEARLVTLAARVPLVMATNPIDVQRRRKITTAVSVSEFRRLAHEGSRKEQGERLFSFFEGGRPDLAAVLDRVESWLELGDDGIGLPPVLQTSIARNSRDVYALLLWLAARSLQEGTKSAADTSGTDLRKSILGLATTLHWFGEDQRRAVDAIATALDDKPLQPGAFRGLLAEAFEVEDRLALHRPLCPGEINELIELPCSSSLNGWTWSKLFQGRKQERRQNKGLFMWRVRLQRELLLYAQRGYIVQRFGRYDPSRQDTWDQHNRPWDFDHILPSAKTYFRHKSKLPHKAVLDEWINCIGNLRACPMEENRSDQDKSPECKLASSKDADNAFIEPQELKGFECGFYDIASADGVIAFMGAAKSRLIRMYHEWYNGLNISIMAEDTVTGASMELNEWSDELAARTDRPPLDGPG